MEDPVISTPLKPREPCSVVHRGAGARPAPSPPLLDLPLDNRFDILSLGLGIDRNFSIPVPIPILSLRYRFLNDTFSIPILFNSIQFSFIYIAPNYNNCHLKALK